MTCFIVNNYERAAIGWHVSKQLQKVLQWTAPLIGTILFIIPFFIRSLGGQSLYDQGFIAVYRTLDIVMWIRPRHATVVLFFLLLAVSLDRLLYWQLKYEAKRDHRLICILRILAKIGIGYLTLEFLFYLFLNSLFYRGAFISYQFLLGVALALLFLVLIYSDGLSYQFFNKEKRSEIFKSRIKIVSLGTYVLLALFILFIIIPTVIPLSGLAPSPPEEPLIPLNGPYDVSMIRFEQDVPSNISDYILPANDNSSWYGYAFMPQLNESRNLPLAFYLHGFGGTNLDDYYLSLKSLASYGVISVFVQYASNVDLSGPFSDPEDTNSTATNALYMRYLMEWSGILQSIDHLQGNGDWTVDELESIVGASFTLDLSRIMLIGHSMGGGMTPFIATRLAEQGWGSNSLILDMEMPWFEATHPLIHIDYSVLPNHTIVNIVGSEDDHLVSPCVGMNHFENLWNVIVDTQYNSNLYYLVIHSDRYGYPRLVATHYVPTDPVYDALSQWAYFNKIGAMAIYLSALANNESYEAVDLFFINEAFTTSFMGQWSDGTHVTRRTITQDPFGLRGEENIAVSFIDDHSYGQEVCVR